MDEGGLFKMTREVHEAIKQIFLKRNPSCKEKELLWRADQRLEWVCEHGIGHTVFAPEPENWVHGCDSCCKNLVTFTIKFNVPKEKKE